MHKLLNSTFEFYALGFPDRLLAQEKRAQSNGRPQTHNSRKISLSKYYPSYQVAKYYVRAPLPLILLISLTIPVNHFHIFHNPSTMLRALAIFWLLSTVFATISYHGSHPEKDYAAPCYAAQLPPLTPNSENRTIPWGEPSFTLQNRTMCCSSLDQVRAGIDEVDDQLLSLLAQRVAYGACA